VSPRFFGVGAAMLFCTAMFLDDEDAATFFGEEPTAGFFDDDGERTASNERCDAVAGTSKNFRRASESRIVTVPSGATAQLAPVGKPPSSPSSRRASRKAPIQFAASTSSWCSGVFPLSGVTRKRHFFDVTDIPWF
jgi:hypothetical protein